MGNQQILESHAGQNVIPIFPNALSNNSDDRRDYGSWQLNSGQTLNGQFIRLEGTDEIFYTNLRDNSYVIRRVEPEVWKYLGPSNYSVITLSFHTMERLPGGRSITLLDVGGVDYNPTPIKSPISNPSTIQPIPDVQKNNNTSGSSSFSYLLFGAVILTGLVMIRKI